MHMQKDMPRRYTSVQYYHSHHHTSEIGRANTRRSRDFVDFAHRRFPRLLPFPCARVECGWSAHQNVLQFRDSKPTMNDNTVNVVTISRSAWKPIWRQQTTSLQRVMGGCSPLAAFVTQCTALSPETDLCYQLDFNSTCRLPCLSLRLWTESLASAPSEITHPCCSTRAYQLLKRRSCG